GPAGVLSAARGEDHELCWALSVLGKRLLYDDRLRLRHFMRKERLQITYLRKIAAGDGIAWNERVVRFTRGLDGLGNRRARVVHAIKSAIRWVRHLNWPEERSYQASMFLAACGWTNRMSDFERKVYVASEWLRSARRAKELNH